MGRLEKEQSVCVCVRLHVDVYGRDECTPKTAKSQFADRWKGFSFSSNLRWSFCILANSQIRLLNASKLYVSMIIRGLGQFFLGAISSRYQA